MVYVVKNVFFCVKYCEICIFGELLQLIYGILDEDVCNVDDGSWLLIYDVWFFFVFMVWKGCIYFMFVFFFYDWILVVLLYG